MNEIPTAFWSFSAQELLPPVETTLQGITRNEARRRLPQEGANRSKSLRRSTSLGVLVSPAHKPLFKGKPVKALTWAALLLIPGTLILPYTPLAILFDFHPLASSYFLWIGGILFLYVFSAESVKNHFSRGMVSGG